MPRSRSLPGSLLRHRPIWEGQPVQPSDGAEDRRETMPGGADGALEGLQWEVGGRGKPTTTAPPAEWGQEGRTFLWRPGSQPSTITRVAGSNRRHRPHATEPHGENGAMKSATRLELDGMSCQHCVRRVRETLEALEGVTVEEVSIGSATFHLAEGEVRVDQVEEALREVGYDPR